MKTRLLINVPAEKTHAVKTHASSTPRARLHTGMLMIVLSASAGIFAPAYADDAAANSSGNPSTKPVGTATRAWMNEQREGVNRAEPQPYPAERASMALRRYENTFSNPADSGSASRSGTGIGIRSGASNSSSTGAPGMTR